MSTFWGYPGADILAFILIGGASAICLYCALLFVKGFGE